MDDGKNILKMFDMAIDELVKMNLIDCDTAKNQKSALRENIKEVG